MDNFNNNSFNNNTDSRSGYNSYNSGYYHYTGAQGSYYGGERSGAYGGAQNGAYGRPVYGTGNMGSTNEYSYHPSSSAVKKKNRVMPVVVAVMCVCIVAVGSVAGYNLIAGGGAADSSSAIGARSSQGGASGKTQAASSVDRSNLPSIEQLSTPEDALSIPEIVDLVSPSVVGISSDSGGTSIYTGTGIILSEDGYIITNAHVVSNSINGSGISVMLHESYSGEGEDGSELIDAALVGRDTQSDIAVLKIDRNGLKPATLGTSSEIKVGEASIVIGNPLGFELKGSVTAGIISATDRTLTVEDRTMKLIQTDASINSGNSGGPLINAYGQVIGITSVKVSSTYGEGLGFAIPIDEAIPIISDLMEYGYVTGRPTLGISGRNISEVYSQYYGVPQGFMVTDITSGGPAAAAGLEIGDIIVGINGTTIETVEELNAEKEKFKAGETVTIAYYRNSKINSVDLVLGDAAETGKETGTQSDNYGGYDDYGSYRGYYGGFGF